jgi:hypothetical protein
MAQLIAPFAHSGTALQQAIHRAHRGDVTPFIEQLGMDRRRCAVDEAGAVEHVENDTLFMLGQRQRRAPSWRCNRGWQLADMACCTVAIQHAARHAQGTACRCYTDLVGQAADGTHYFGSPVVSEVVSPSRMESFFGRQ